MHKRQPFTKMKSMKKWSNSLVFLVVFLSLPKIDSFCDEGSDKSKQIILVVGNSRIVGNVGEVTNDTISNGMGFRYLKSQWGGEFIVNYADFTRKTTNDFALDSDIRVISGEVSGLCYFGPPSQVRGFAKLGAGMARSKLKLSHSTENPESQDPLAVAGIGIDFGADRKIGGLIELDLKQIFMRGEDIKTTGIIAGLTYNW